MEQTLYLATGGGEIEREAGAFARLAFNLDFAAVSFEDPSADSEADPGSLDFAIGVEPLEDFEYLLLKFGFDSGAVVSDLDDPASGFFRGSARGDFDLWI